MPLTPDTSVIGPNAISGGQGATSFGFSGAGVSTSIDPAGVFQVSIPGGGSGVAVQVTGTGLGTAGTLNFVGSGATASFVGSTAHITLSAGGASGDTPGGTSNSIQYYSNATTLGGSARLYNESVSGNLSIVSLTSTQSAATPAAGTGSLFVRQRGGRVLPNFIGPSGLDFPMQPMLGMNRIYLQQANPGATTWTTIGGAAAGVIGTAAAATPASTNFSSSLRRVNINSGAVAKSGSGLQGGVATYWLGGGNANQGGFYMVYRAVLGTIVTGNTSNFIGFTGSAVSFTPTNTSVDPSGCIQICGVGKSWNATNYSLYCAGGAAQAAIDTGLSATGGDVIEARIFARPGATYVSMSLEIICRGGTNVAYPNNLYFEGGSANTPTNTTFMDWRAYTQTTTTTAVNHSPISVYIETDT